jgi:hypothetical protein
LKNYDNIENKKKQINRYYARKSGTITRTF